MLYGIIIEYNTTEHLSHALTKQVLHESTLCCILSQSTM